MRYLAADAHAAQLPVTAGATGNQKALTLANFDALGGATPISTTNRPPAFHRYSPTPF